MITVWFDKSVIEQSESATRADEKIAALNAIIDTLFGAMAKAATTGNMEEYRLDDGQTKISVKYKDLASIAASHDALIKTKQYYINAKNGRRNQLVDSNAFPKSIC